MNKIASFVEYYRNLGSAQALATYSSSSLTKQASVGRLAGAAASRLIPKSRLGRLAGAAAGGGLAAAGYKAMNQPEQGMLESAYEGGKDMLSNMSQEELMGYANLLSNLSQGGYGSSMGYSAAEASPMDYALTDMGGAEYYDPSASMGYAAMDPYSQMGYEAMMSPEEASQYYEYYNS